MEQLAYDDSCAAINSYLSRTGAWELCLSPVKEEEEERQQASFMIDEKRKVEG